MTVSLLAAQRAAGQRSLRALRSTVRSSSRSARQLAQVALLHRSYLAAGGARGRMGFPMTALEVRADRSVARRFEGGELRLTASGEGIVVNQKAFTVYFVGLECMRESSWDQGTPHDEPYVMWFVQSGSITTSSTRKSFTKIDTGSAEVVTDSSITGPINSVGVPFVVSALVVEHDSGDKEQASRKFDEVIRDGVAIGNEVIDQVNNYSGSTSISRLPPPVNMPVLSKLIGGLLGLEDDYIGSGIAEVFLAVPGETIDQLTARIKSPPHNPKKFKDQATYSHMMEVGTPGEGRYRLYFRVEIRTAPGEGPT